MTTIYYQCLKSQFTADYKVNYRVCITVYTGKNEGDLRAIFALKKSENVYKC